MIIEFAITSLIVLAAVYIFYKNIKQKSLGKCDCGSCSSHCSKYKNTR